MIPYIFQRNEKKVKVKTAKNDTDIDVVRIAYVLHPSLIQKLFLSFQLIHSSGVDLGFGNLLPE